MLLVGYQNPTHKDRNGAFCERSNGNNACDNAFIICIRRRNSHDCDFERLETNKIEEDNDNLMFSEGEPVGRIDNPIAISGDIWPVSGVGQSAGCSIFNKSIRIYMGF